MRGQTVLVTGGAGYVGAATCLALHDAGIPHVVLDDLSMGHREHVKWGPLVEGDIADVDLVRSVIAEHDVTGILHFAAKALVAESVADPDLYDRWNRGKTETLVQTAEAAGIGAFVFSSSCAVYGEPVRVPLDEDHPQAPTSPYGESKRACEAALFAAGVPAIALRYFNAAGAVPAEGLGELHDPETHLIPLVLRATDEKPLRVFGRDWDTPDGTCIRDYIHVVDLASAHVAALQHLLDGRPSMPLNLGTGSGSSVLEIIAAVERVRGTPVPVVEASRRLGDPAWLVADAKRAHDVLGWTAKLDLDRIVTDALTFEETQARL